MPLNGRSLIYVFITECANGLYGERCSSKCPACLNGICNNIDGSCPHGCDAGFTGEKCTTGKV